MCVVAKSLEKPKPDLEGMFAKQLSEAGESNFCRQSIEPYRRSTLRNPRSRSRTDFAWLAEKVHVEVMGATWSGGRHTRGAGYEKDCQKRNDSLLDGWLALTVTGKMVQSGEALRVTQEALALRRE